MNRNIKNERIKPNFQDYLVIVFTRYLPVTNKIRRKIRYKLLRRKNDIVLYEAKSYIFSHICIGLLFAEILYQFIAVQFNFNFQDTVISNIFAFFMEYICFLITIPLSAFSVYPFTGFWVRLEDKE